MLSIGGPRYWQVEFLHAVGQPAVPARRIMDHAKNELTLFVLECRRPPGEQRADGDHRNAQSLDQRTARGGC